MTLFMDPSGPLMKYLFGTLVIEDLNPHAKIRWRLSRGEMFKLGVRCLIAAIKP